MPVTPWRLNREDMTIKMLGISQRLPYPGKRALREEVATKNAESVAFGYRETVNRVVRDVRIAWYDLALVDRSIEVVERNRQLVEHLLRIAEGRYSVGQGAQAELLKAQTQLAKMSEELLRMRRERRTPIVQAPEGLDIIELAGEAEPSEPIEDVLSRKDLGRAVEKAMALLPEEQRTAIIMKEYHGLTFQEIADLLDCPLSTVKTRLYQGLSVLRKQLREDGVHGRM